MSLLIRETLTQEQKCLKQLSSKLMQIKIILLLLLAVCSINSLTCGGNCPSNTCGSCWCGQTANLVNIADECAKFNWNQDCCQCIMARQSGGNANAISQLGTNPPRGPKTGLWQLEEIVRNITCRLEKKQELCSAKLSMECAYKLYQLNINLGQWKPWQQSAIACGCFKQVTTE